jgi:hypothetical protein
MVQSSKNIVTIYLYCIVFLAEVSIGTYFLYFFYF